MYSTDFVVMPYKNVTIIKISSPWRCRVVSKLPTKYKMLEC